jgi:hypothetical protein
MRLTRTTVSSGEIGSHRVEKPRRSVNMTLHRHGTACLRTETDRHVDTLRTSVTYSCGG